MSIILMGPMGCGKTSVGLRLASALGFPFVDGDDHHTESSRSKMKVGIPLDDEDRAPWLAQLRTLLESREAPLVLACSALKRRYRSALDPAGRQLLVYLRVPAAELARRLSARAHFASPLLLNSQLETLELSEEDPILVVDGQLPIDQLVKQIVEAHRIHTEAIGSRELGS